VFAALIQEDTVWHPRSLLCSAIIPSASLWTITLAARIIVRTHNLAAEGHLDNDTIHAPAPRCVASCFHAAHAGRRYRAVPPALSSSAHDPCRRKPLFAEAGGAVSRAPCDTQTCSQRHASHSDLAQSFVSLAAGVSHCAPGDLSPLASAGIPALLAL